MYSSSDLVEALRRRQRRSLRPEREAGEFPEGWRVWLASMRDTPGRVRGAAAGSIVSILVEREPRLPPAAVAAMGRWQAFASLWRQDWHPATRDERGVRVFTMVATLVLHVLFTVVVAWLMYMRFLTVLEPEPPRGDDTVQVEFIGDGTPAETGGGAADGETLPSPPPAPANAATQATTSAELPPPAVADTNTPTESQPAPESAQPLRVTETPTPDSRFVLPPARDLAVPVPALATPDLTARTRVVDVVQPPALERPLPVRDVTVPDLRQAPAEVVLREIPAALPQVRMRPMPATPAAAPTLSAQAPAVPSRSIPAPAGTQATGTTNTDASSAAINNAGFPAGARAQDESGTGRSPTATGAGTSNAPPGAAPGTRRADDWGESSRNRPGGRTASSAPGLFNPDGSPRLAATGTGVGGGLPPGTITEDYEKIDRMGTWLKRPPIGYEATRFDRFWIPHESLLEEWVRRSIKEVLIPIPGTGKTISCKVALLALGGACGISDPNLLDIEATARKAPDVPFKRELQENQDALAEPAPRP